MSARAGVAGFGEAGDLILQGISENRALLHGDVEDAAQESIGDGQRRGANSWHSFRVRGPDSLGRHVGEGYQVPG